VLDFGESVVKLHQITAGLSSGFDRNPNKNAHKKFECHIIIKLIIKIKKS